VATRIAATIAMVAAIAPPTAKVIDDRGRGRLIDVIRIVNLADRASALRTMIGEMIGMENQILIVALMTGIVIEIEMIVIRKETGDVPRNETVIAIRTEIDIARETAVATAMIATNVALNKINIIAAAMMMLLTAVAVEERVVVATASGTKAATGERIAAVHVIETADLILIEAVKELVIATAAIAAIVHHRDEARMLPSIAPTPQKRQNVAVAAAAAAMNASVVTPVVDPRPDLANETAMAAPAVSSILPTPIQLPQSQELPLIRGLPPQVLPLRVLNSNNHRPRHQQR
jgi:hypothetical protein